MTRPALPRGPDLRPLLARRPEPFAGLTAAAADELLSAAVRHGLLAAVVGRLPPDDARLRARCERLARGARLRDARVREVLEEALRGLASAGITPVALKGPVLADRVHPDPGLRVSSDLDLLVPEEALDRAAAVLLAMGFARADPLVDAYQRRHHHHLHLLRRPGPDLELHFRAQSACGADLPTGALLARALPHRTSFQTPVLVLAPEDELIALALHATGHLLQRASWLLDLVLFVERHPGLDWPVVAARAAEFRCRRAVGYALEQVRSLGAEIPELPALALGARRRAACARLAAWALPRNDRPGNALRMAFELLLWDRPRSVPAYILLQGGWFLRRRVHFLARRLTRAGARRALRGPL